MKKLILFGLIFFALISYVNAETCTVLEQNTYRCVPCEGAFQVCLPDTSGNWVWGGHDPNGGGEFIPDAYDDMSCDLGEVCIYSDGLKCDLYPNNHCVDECGNGQLQQPNIFNNYEECDLGEDNNNCDYVTNTVCDSNCDLTSCVAPTCGDNICESIESNHTCLMDCAIDGWHATTTGWVLTSDNELSSGGVGDASAYIYTDYFDLKADKNYVISGRIKNANTGCDAAISLDEGNCLSAKDRTVKECFSDPTYDQTKVSGNSDWQLKSYTFNIPSSDNVDSNGMYKKIRLKLSIYCDSQSIISNSAYFDDISLREVSEINAIHDIQSPIDAVSACCPNNYCWSGSECVISDFWNDSSKSNLWNSLTVFNNPAWPNNHLNISKQWLSKGYRCILNDTGYAEWRPAQIKYAWDFEESGYCMRDTDCFVGYDYASSNPDVGNGCIKNNEFINDTFELNHGGHYCKDGSWTTKTALIANVLENITKEEDYPYILFCDDTGRIFNNAILDYDYTEQGDNNNVISGGCILISKTGNNKERIITGVYLDNPSPKDGSGNVVDSFMCTVYKQQHFDINNQLLDTCTNYVDPSYNLCDTFGESPFIKCIDEDNLKLYVNTDSYYYLISKDSIGEIEQGFFYVLWNSIKDFFQKLFGYTPMQPLGLTNQTTNYDRVYILSNNSLSVSAIEESKYDETLAQIMAYMYLNMTGSDIISDKFNLEFINNSVQGVFYEDISQENSRSLIIKYKDPAQVWSYLTAMIRDR